MRRTGLLLSLSMVVCLLSLRAAAQAPPSNEDSLGSLLENGVSGEFNLLGRYAVQSKLGLNEEQKENLEKIERDLASQRTARASEFSQRLRSAANDDERRRLTAEQIRRILHEGEENDKRVAALLSESQKAGLRQLWIQKQGVSALFDPQVIAELEITDDQLDMIRRAIPFRRPSRFRMDESLAKGLQVLTEKQRTRFDKLRGKEFMPDPLRSPGIHLATNGLPDEYSLLLKDEVVEEVKLTDRQKDVLQATQRRERRPSSFQGFTERVNIMRWAPEDVRERLRNATMSIAAGRFDESQDNGDRLAAALTDDQKTRLGQLWIQYLGEMALLGNQDVITALKLTDEQRQRMGLANPPRVWNAGAGPGEKARLAKLLELLTPEQQKQFDELRGKEFEFRNQSEGPGGSEGRAAPQQLGVESLQDLVSNGVPGKYVLLQYRGVQDELGLSPMQKQQVLELEGELVGAQLDQVRECQKAISSAAGADERRELAQALIRAVRDQAAKGGKRIADLLTEAQRTRLAQLWLQQRGADALFDPEVVAELELADDQLHAMMQRAAIELRLATTSERRSAVLESLLRNLTEKQRSRFDELRGRDSPAVEQTSTSTRTTAALLRNRLGMQLMLQDEVQAELGLTGEQKALLTEIRQDANALERRDMEIRWLSDVLRWAPQEQQAGGFSSRAALREEKADGNAARLARALTDTQNERLGQLWFQYRFQFRGVDAMLDPDVIAKLELSAQQQQELRRSMFQRTDGMEVLTDQQRARLSELRGKEFKFAEPPAARRTPRPAFGAPRPQRAEERNAPAGETDRTDVYRRYAAAMVKKYDTSGDGALQAAEWKQMSQSPADADADRDGNITPEELGAWYMKR